ncbi:MAG: AAA family ATPase [Flavobacteriaceae bacterium]|jgi:HTH-type transcriptional repressor of NAD biosynthesis genes
MEKSLAQADTRCLKVVLYGPESTGKSTLAQKLAKHYNTLWVPEYARTYLQKKWDEHQAVCTIEDLVPIAYGQMHSENQKAAQANNILFCDTDLLVTQTYSEIYFEGQCPPIIREYVQKNTYDLYLLMSTDLPWIADDLRDRPNDRSHMFERFQQSLIDHNKPYVIISGDGDTRFKMAIDAIENRFAHV